MRILLAAALFQITATIAYSQLVQPPKFSLEWNKGSVHFKSGDSLTCEVRFNQNGMEPILQIRDHGQTLTLPIGDVNSFSFFDQKRQRVRRFSVYNNPTESDRTFYMENIFFGRHFAILNQKTMEVPHELMNFSRFFGKPVKTFKKFILNRDTGEMLPLSKENAMVALNARKAEIAAFIDSNDLRFKKVSDFISVFSFHDTLE